MRPLNFLHLTTFYPPYSFGGDAMYIYRLSHALGEAGHKVDVIHEVDAYHLKHPADPEIDFTGHPNVSRFGLRSRYGLLSPVITHQTGKPHLLRYQIQGILNQKSYDVIQYHNISLLGPGILAAVPRNENFLKLYMTHEHWLVCPTHVLWKYNRRACDKPDCLPCTILAKRPPQIWRYTGQLERMSQNVDRFLSPSRFTAQMHADRGFSKPVEYLPYFIHQVDQDWKKPGPVPNPLPYFLFVGRLEKIKGLHTLIDLWNQVKDFDLLIAGTGTEEKQLRSKAAGNQQVKFLGPLPQSELGNLYYHARATIVPSLTYETFGIIIVESFARKTPVIVRNLGALPEVVNESKGGFIFQDDKQLLEAINQLGHSLSLRNELGEYGYSAFLKYWSKDAHMKLYFDLLNEVALEKFGFIPWES